MIRMCDTIPEVFDHLANQHQRGSEGLEKVQNYQDCLQRKPLEWRVCLNNIDEFLQKWTVVQKLNIAQYSTKPIVQGLVEHLLLFQQQEDWYGKRAKSQAVATRNSKKVGLIGTRV